MIPRVGGVYSPFRAAAGDLPIGAATQQVPQRRQPGPAPGIRFDTAPVGPPMARLQALAAAAGLGVWAQSLPESRNLLVGFVDPETGHAIQRVLTDATEVTLEELRASMTRPFEGWA
jgi:hypothetical protein